VRQGSPEARYPVIEEGVMPSEIQIPSEVPASEPSTPLHSRRLLASTGVTAGVIFALLVGMAISGQPSEVAQSCSATNYILTSSNGAGVNWTATSAWTPTGFPGSGSCDSATDLNAIATPVIVNSVIPNGLQGLTASCTSCQIDIQAGGQLTLDGPGTVGSGTIIRVHSGGTLVVNASAMSGGLSFNSGSALELDGGTVSGAGAVINNGGTIDANSGVSTISAEFDNNSGNVNVNGGTLSLSGGGTGNGPFNLTGGATLDFPSGNYTMTTGGVVSGAGTLSITGGYLKIGGVTSPGGFVLRAGTLDGDGFLSVGTTFDWSGGTMSGGGGAELGGNGTGTISGGTGAMSLAGRKFNDYGTINYTAVTNLLTLSNGGILNVFGTFNITDDGSILCACDGGESVNVSPNGILVKNGGSGTSVIAPPMTNAASVWSASGTLQIAGDGTHTGNFYAFSGATLAFSAANTTFAPNSSVNADGTIDFPSGGSTSSNGNFDVAGKTSISGGMLRFNNMGKTKDFAFNMGDLYLDAPFSMSGTGNWSCGVISNGGVGGFFDVLMGATLTIDAANSSPTLDGALFKNHGTVNYTAPGPNNLLTLMNSSTIENHGLFDLKTDATIVSGFGVIIGSGTTKSPAATAAGASPVPRTNTARPPNLFENFGTLQKSGGSGTTAFQPDLLNHGAVKAQSGTIDFQGTFVQDAGSTALEGGNIQKSGTALAINGGSLNGNGSITGDVNNAGGTVAPGTAMTTGTVTITGNYTQGSGATLSAKLGNPASNMYDKLTVSATATLSGALTATIFNSYTPANGDIWTPLTFASNAGTFTTESLPPSITSSYTPTSYVLTAVVAPSADLTISKTGPGGVTAGQNITYTIVVKNNGGSTATGVTVTDPQPANLTFVSNSGACTGAFPCNLGTLTNGQSATILSTYSTSPTFSGSVSNTATVSPTTTDPNPMNNSATAVTNVGAQADLSISKSGPMNASTGQTITYAVVVSNAGPSPAANTIVSDPTPVGVAFVSNSGACTTPYPCALGTLAAGQSATIMSTYTIPGNYTGATVVNTATVNSSTNDPNNLDNTSGVTTSVAQQTDVAVVKSGPATASPGLPIVYTIVASNNGATAAANVVVSDVTPAGLTFVSNAGACTSAFPCNLGTLNPGQSATITATYAVSPTYSSPTIVNTASITTTAADPNSANNSSTVTTPINTQADISVTKSGPPSFTGGQNLVYTVVVSNIGTLPAANTFISDPTPAGINFVSNTGACTTAYPCSLGTLVPGQSVTITSTYNVPITYAGTTISNTATGSTSSPDPNAANNSGSVTTPRSTAGGADVSISKGGPGSATTGSTINFSIVVDNHGPAIATSVVVFDPTPAGFQFVSNSGSCTTPFPCSLGSLNPAQSATIIARYKVVAQPGSFVTNVANVTSAVDPDSSNNRSSRGVAILATPVCPQQAPRLFSPAPGATITSPATFSWSSVPNAIGYRLTINGSGGPTVIQTTRTSLTLAVPSGASSWFVETVGNFGCQPISSDVSGFTVCIALGAPTPSVVGEATTGQTYTVEWTPVDAAISYELQESLTSTFGGTTTFALNGTAKTFTKNIQNATPFFYRVRAISLCSEITNPWSPTISVVIIPLPNPDGSGNGIVLPYGTAKPVTFQIFVPGLAGITTSFVATVDKPWLAVSPTNGVIGPEGVTLSIFADPAALTAGTWNGTVLVVYGTTGVIGKTALAAGTSKAIPVSINLTTPVSPASLTTPAATALLIPSVGHLAGVSSNWRSDIRVANTSITPVKYQVTFSLANGDAATLLKQTIVSVDAGVTLALDDIVRNWYGVGSLADSANGVLSIQALDSSGNAQPAYGGGSKTTVVSSRTYNAASTGTLGQFIPATPFANFIGRAGGAALSSILSLQQVAQTDAYRTNLGLVEGSGKPASVAVNVFDASGAKVLSVPVSLAAGEQKQLNGFLAQNGITIANGRIEVQVTGGDGRVTSYASVIDNRTGDPLLVSGTPLGGLGANRFVVPGVADLNTPNAKWRSDLRVFNSSAVPQATMLTFFPIGNSSPGTSKDITINPGEVKALDSILQSLFGVSDAGGAVHVTTPTDAPLVVTARTYDDTGNGTLGQFIPAVTAKDAIGTNDRTLQILQVEDSARYRTNLGVVEVSGKPAIAEVTVFLPDSKVSPRVQIPLGAYESRQFPILSSLGLGATYNARLSIRVIDGDGKVTAYGSVVDMTTQDPTYVPAQ